jgi:hypothetical protein
MAEISLVEDLSKDSANKVVVLFPGGQSKIGSHRCGNVVNLRRFEHSKDDLFPV